jgi:hypothetical protein
MPRPTSHDASGLVCSDYSGVAGRGGSGETNSCLANKLSPKNHTHVLFIAFVVLHLLLQLIDSVSLTAHLSLQKIPFTAALKAAFGLREIHICVYS